MKDINLVSCKCGIKFCAYCGEEEATVTIPNPNISDDWSEWDVCKDCKEVIYLQQRLSIANIIGDEKMISDTNRKLEEIAKRIGKPIMNVCVVKSKEGGYDTASVEFPGRRGFDAEIKIKDVVRDPKEASKPFQGFKYADNVKQLTEVKANSSQH